MPRHRIERKQNLLISDILRSVTRGVSSRPILTLSCVFLLAGASIAFTVTSIRFKTDRADLIDPEAPFHKRWKSYTECFGEQSDLVVVVEADSPESIKHVIDELGSQMQAEPESFSQVLFKIEPGRLRNKGLQYLSPDQLETALDRLAEYRPVFRGAWHLTELSSLISRLAYQLQTRLENSAVANGYSAHSALPHSSPEADRATSIDPLLDHAFLLATSLSLFAYDRNEFRSPWPELLPVTRRMRDEANEVVYFLDDGGTLGFLKAFPVRGADDFRGSTRSINRLRQIVSAASARHPDVQIGVTGIPVLENDEMLKSQEDMLNASLISVVGVGLLLFLGFRGFRHPALALVMLAVGMAWSFGYTTLVVGHLNILSVSFAAILIGLGIDFAIHYLARYLQLRHAEHSLRTALLESSGEVGTGILTAAVTTALAFFCAALTSFLGVAELGVIAGGGILLCAAATFVVLPALITLADRRIAPRRLPTPFQGNFLRLMTSRHPLAVTLVGFVIIGFFASKAIGIDNRQITWNIGYDYNLLNLQADGLESVEIQKRIFRDAQDSLLFAVSVADTAEEARRLHKQFAALPSVHHVEELASRLPSSPLDQTHLLVQAFDAELSQLNPTIPHFTNTDPREVGRSFEKLYDLIRSVDTPLGRRARAAIDAFLDAFEQLSFTQQAALLYDYQPRMAVALLRQFEALAAAADPEPVRLDDFPTALTSRFVSPHGKWLVQVFPKDQIWEIEPLTRFVRDVRSVDANVTGTPLQNYEASQQIMDSYQRAAAYALVVICLVLLVDFLGRRHLLAVVIGPALLVGSFNLALRYQGISIDRSVLISAFVTLTMLAAAWLDFHSLRDTALAIMPPITGGLIMFGILAMTNVEFNPANLIVLPLVLGIGVDDGVHVIHDFRAQRHRYRMSSSTINAIVLTSLTSMIGFGSMMVAAHRGLYSLGLVLVIGVGSCLFVSLVPLPAILTLISNRQRREIVKPIESIALHPAEVT